MLHKVISIIGSLNRDLVTLTPRIPMGGETLAATSFTTNAGGKGANQATACARLSRPKPYRYLATSDLQVHMIGAVGADEFGHCLIESMSVDGIDTSGIKIVNDQSTGVAVILVEESSGENRILLSPGANHTLQPQDFLTADSLKTPLPDLIILQLEIPLATVLQIVETAKRAGVDVLLNPAPAVPLPSQIFQGLAHLVLNESEAAILTGRSVVDVKDPLFDWALVANEFIAKGVRNCVVTLGSKGAFFACAGENEKGELVPATKIDRVIDTTAAGDTFVGGYAVNVVRGGNEMCEIVKWACKAAGRTVERRGAQAAIPWADEVDR